MRENTRTRPPVKPTLRSVEVRNRLVTDNLGLVGYVVNLLWDRADVRRMGRANAWQKGVLGLIRAAELFDPALGWKFSSYAVPSITNAVTNALRDQDPPEAPLFDPDAHAAPRAADHAEEWEVVEAASAGLLEKDRRALRLYYLGDMTLEQVGREMGGVTKETIRQRVQRALARIRDALGVNDAAA